MMTEAFYLILGSVLLVVIMYDFFYTTLSASGAGFFTRFIMLYSHKLMQLLVSVFGRRVYSLSGMVVNLMVLGAWVLLVWLGLLILYSSNPDGVVNNSGRTATLIERLYFTGYTLSTLGLGNFTPDTSFFKVLTSCFSFFGFIFFTTAMTYLISVSSAVIHKRSLALNIYNMGTNPQELVDNLMRKDATYCYARFASLQEMIDRHSVNHQAYPVVHFYSNFKIESSLSINLTVLDEAITILLTAGHGSKFQAELSDLRRSLTHFLNLIGRKYPGTLHARLDSESLPLDESSGHSVKEGQLQVRRTLLRGFLENENFSWQDIYPERRTGK